MAKNVRLNDKQIATAKAKMRDVQVVQRDFETYIEGCMDGLGLKGDYQLDIKTWTFVPVKKEADVP